MLPDLIADDGEVMGDCDIGDDLQLVGPEQPPCRVLRVVEEDRSGSRRHCGLQGIALDSPTGRPQRHLARSRSCPSDHRRVAVVGGREDDHLVAGLDGGKDYRTERLGRSAGDADMIGIELLAEMSPVMVGDRFPQLRQPARGRILVRAFLQRAGRFIEDLLRPAEIREALAEVDRAVLRGGEAHPLEHADLHLLVERVHSSAPLERNASISGDA
jgi:hypothetical protein